MKKRIEKWLKETMAIACLLLIAMPMTASKKVLFDKMKGQYRIPAIVQCKSAKISQRHVCQAASHSPTA